MQRFAAQIEEAVTQADILGIFLLARHRHRQLLSRGQHSGAARIDFDLAGCEVGIDRAFAAGLHLAVDGHDAFDAQGFENGERGAVAVGHDLGHAVVITQVHEQDAAVIALAVHPARQADGLANIPV